jgi:hypothetical protein
MTVDEMIIAQRLKELRREAVETDLCIANAQVQLEKDQARIAKQEVKLDKLVSKIRIEEQALYWVRMQELLHTPCWRYRVA